MLANYFCLQKKYVEKYGPTTIFLMQCGAFFEVYGVKDRSGQFTCPQIEIFSRVCDMAIAKKKSMYKGAQVFMAGFSPVERLQKYITKLNDAGYTVAVYVQDPTVPSIRNEYGVFSPGTNFELGKQAITNNIMTLWVEKIDTSMLNKGPRLICGMAVVDVFTGTSNIFQYRESYLHQPTTFDEIERFFSTYSPNELIIIHNLDEKDLVEMIKFAGLASPAQHRIRIGDKDSSHHLQVHNAEKQTYQKELLHNFYEINDYGTFYESAGFRDFPLATQAFCFLLNFIYAMQPNLVHKIKEPEFNNVNTRLTLGNHSLRQLNIIPDGASNDSLNCVVAVLNKCLTPMGKRRLSHLILTPTFDAVALEREYAAVDTVLERLEDVDFIQTDLRQILDIERLYRKIVLKRAAPSELALLYQNIKRIAALHTKLTHEASIIVKHIGVPGILKSCTQVSRFLKANLDMKSAANCPTVNFVCNIFKRGQFPALDQVDKDRAESEDQLEACRQLLSNYIAIKETSRRGTKQSCFVKIHETERNGLFLVVTARRAQKLMAVATHMIQEAPDRPPPRSAAHAPTVESPAPDSCGSVSLSYTSSYDGKEGTMTMSLLTLKFSTGPGGNKRIDSPHDQPPASLYTAIMRHRANLKGLVRDKYIDFLTSLEKFGSDIDLIVRYVTRLDTLWTKAWLAKTRKYCRPVIDTKVEKSFLIAKNMRHILIEKLQQDEIYVPNSLSLGVDGVNGFLLYGTNAVGKSSLIRACGICVILAQAGFLCLAVSSDSNLIRQSLLVYWVMTTYSKDLVRLPLRCANYERSSSQQPTKALYWGMNFAEELKLLQL